MLNKRMTSLILVIVLVINIIIQSVFSSFATNIDGLYVSENTRRNVTVNHSQANGFPSDFGLYLCYGESAVTKGYPGNDKMYGGYSFEDNLGPIIVKGGLKPGENNVYACDDNFDNSYLAGHLNQVYDCAYREKKIWTKQEADRWNKLYDDCNIGSTKDDVIKLINMDKQVFSWAGNNKFEPANKTDGGHVTYYQKINHTMKLPPNSSAIAPNGTDIGPQILSRFSSEFQNQVWGDVKGWEKRSYQLSNGGTYGWDNDINWSTTWLFECKDYASDATKSWFDNLVKELEEPEPKEKYIGIYHDLSISFDGHTLTSNYSELKSETYWAFWTYKETNCSACGGSKASNIKKAYQDPAPSGYKYKISDYLGTKPKTQRHRKHGSGNEAYYDPSCEVIEADLEPLDMINGGGRTLVETYRLLTEGEASGLIDEMDTMNIKDHWIPSAKKSQDISTSINKSPTIQQSEFGLEDKFYSFTYNTNPDTNGFGIKRYPVTVRFSFSTVSVNPTSGKRTGVKQTKQISKTWYLQNFEDELTLYNIRSYNPTNATFGEFQGTGDFKIEVQSPIFSEGNDIYNPTFEYMPVIANNTYKDLTVNVPVWPEEAFNCHYSNWKYELEVPEGCRVLYDNVEYGPGSRIFMDAANNEEGKLNFAISKFDNNPRKLNIYLNYHIHTAYQF